MAASLSAADLQQQHAAASGAHDPRSAAPMADPFPALTQDPFPAVPVATQAPVQEKTAARQPAARLDVDSQSAFPSLAAASTAAPAAGKWSQKLKPSASPAASGRSTPVSGTPGGWAGTAPVIQRTTFTDTFSIPIADDTLTKLGSVMQRVQQKLKHTTVEASTTRKTGTTTFVVKARNEKDLAQARKELRVLLAKNVRSSAAQKRTLGGSVGCFIALTCPDLSLLMCIPSGHAHPHDPGLAARIRHWCQG